MDQVIQLSPIIPHNANGSSIKAPGSSSFFLLTAASLLFATQCQDLLVAARDLMKDDIHNTVQVDKYSDKAVLSNLAAVQKVVELEKKTHVSTYHH